MRPPPLLIVAATAVGLLASISVPASPIVIDDFTGGPDLAVLSVNPGDSVPLTAGGSFLHAGAIGGERDVVVNGLNPGEFFSGVAFNIGGFASFSGGTGEGIIIWDGTEGDPLHVDFGLGHLNFLADCPSPNLHVRAFAGLAGADLGVFVYTSASDIARYVIPLTTVGSFANYDIPLTAPTQTFGSVDFSDINAVSIFVEGSSLPNLEVYVRELEITCVPEGGSSLIYIAAGFAGLVTVSRKLQVGA